MDQWESMLKKVEGGKHAFIIIIIIIIITRPTTEQHWRPESSQEVRSQEKQAGHLKCAVTLPRVAPRSIATAYQFAMTSCAVFPRRVTQAITVYQTATNELISIF